MTLSYPFAITIRSIENKNPIPLIKRRYIKFSQKYVATKGNEEVEAN